MDIAFIKEELENTPHGARSALIEKYARLYKVSAATLRRKLRNAFGPAKTVKREPKIEQWLINEIAKIKISGMNYGDADRELSTEECIEILKMKGIKEAEKLTPSTVNRRLRESGFRMRDPIVRVEAKYANQTHQLDFSRSKYFQVIGYDQNAGDYKLKVSGKTLAYKEHEKKYRLWLVGLTDTFSRVSLAQAYPATGESAGLGLQFMNFAYNREEDEHPLHYIPDTLKTDNGSFIKSEPVRNALKALQIKAELVEPYKKRGIQKREAAWRMIWQRFELRLALILGKGAEIFLSEYNELLHEKMIELMEWKHPVKNATRGHVYLTGIAVHPPREISADLREIAFRTMERRVRQDLTISVDNVKYEAPLFALDKRIRVYRNSAGEMIGELIDEFRKPFILKPTEGFVTEGDFTHRKPKGYRYDMETELKREQKETKKGKINYMPPRPQKVTPETKFTEVAETPEYFFPTVSKAKIYISKRLQSPYEAYADIFDQLLNSEGGLNKNNIDDVINYLKQKAVNH